MNRYEWIPVEEKSPNEGERVLCTHESKFGADRQVIEHIYINGRFVDNWILDMDKNSSTFGEYLIGDVVAWTAIPEPYKGV